MSEDKHDCEFLNQSAGYGVAVDACWEREDGTFWVGNGEYESQINFRPWCGFAARVRAEIQRE